MRFISSSVIALVAPNNTLVRQSALCRQLLLSLQSASENHAKGAFDATGVADKLKWASGS